MLLIVIKIISAAAFLLLVAYISCLMTSAETGKDDRKNFLSHIFKLSAPLLFYLSYLSLLVVFLFLPIGSLPSFVRSEYNIFVLFFLLFAAQFFYGCYLERTVNTKKNLTFVVRNSLGRFAFALAAVMAVLSWSAYSTGMPGKIYGLDVYTAVPLWSVFGIVGKIGLFCLLLSLLFASYGTNSNTVPLGEEQEEICLFYSLKDTLILSLICLLFFPYNISTVLSLSGLFAFFADFIFFWIKSFILRKCLAGLIFRFCSRCVTVDHAAKVFRAIVLLLVLSGALLMFSEIKIL